MAHNINVKDNVQTKDNLSTWKRWFNGAKHFFTVKSLPPSATLEKRDTTKRQ